MPVKKIYTVTDLGPGDGGKGGVVHKLAHMRRAHTIIKVGGAQGSHGVSNSAGERFAFSQWGCGTFEWVSTHLSHRFTVSPEGLLNEGAALQDNCGIHDPFRLLTMDERALCATPYHGIASRLQELARGKNPRGTIGSGVGEANRDSLRVPELALYGYHLRQLDLRDRLAAIREEQRRKLDEIIRRGFLPEDQEVARKEIDLLHDDEFLEYILERFQQVAARANIVPPEYLKEDILSRDGMVVVESSHGILTDQLHGFHPHTSAIRTLPRFTQAMLREAGYDGPIVNLGIHRAYTIRHGAGPMPTATPEIGERLLPGSHKETDRYKGDVRVGPLDLVLLRYAIEVCGGAQAFNGLVITWFDQIQANGTWHLCHRYHGVNDPTYFTPEGAIKVRDDKNEGAQLAHQHRLAQQLFSCRPEIDTIKLSPSMGRDELYSLCAQTLKSLGAVRMISFGSTEQDKMCG